MRVRHVAAHGVPFVPVHTSLTLLEIDRVRRQVPVRNRVAVGVEVEPFLPHGRRRQDERPERRIERRTLGVVPSEEQGDLERETPGAVLLDGVDIGIVGDAGRWERTIGSSTLTTATPRSAVRSSQMRALARS